MFCINVKSEIIGLLVIREQSFESLTLLTPLKGTKVSWLSSSHIRFDKGRYFFNFSKFSSHLCRLRVMGYNAIGDWGAIMTSVVSRNKVVSLNPSQSLSYWFIMGDDSLFTFRGTVFKRNDQTQNQLTFYESLTKIKYFNIIIIQWFLSYI